MALIDLKLLSEVAIQGTEQKFILDTYCYNHERKTQPEDDIIVFLYKSYIQSDNLFTKLQKLHQVSGDLASGNTLPYSLEFDYYRDYNPDAEIEIYNPFDTLVWCFNSSSIDDLPVQIEQYVELKQMVDRFSVVQTKKREGLNKFFGHLTRYQATTGPDGETVMIPMSQEMLDEVVIKNQIEEVNIEYCLDRYNEFYLICQSLLDSHQVAGSYTACAEEILSLFAPYPFTPTPIKT